MPELPEVETVRRGLERLVVGRRIVAVDALNPGSLDAPIPLDGVTVTAARRRAKMLILDLDDGRSLAVHLKMTGQLVIRHPEGVERQVEGVSVAQRRSGGIAGGSRFGLAPAANDAGRSQRPLAGFGEAKEIVDERSEEPTPAVVTGHPDRASSTVSGRPGPAGTRVPDFEWPVSSAIADEWGGGHPSDSLIGELPDRSTRVVFDLDDGGRLFFNDQRKFGWIRAVPREIADGWTSAYGPEPTDEDAWPRFRALVRRHPKALVKAVLLDQAVVAGIGNIYADEALWGARVHPASRVGALSDKALHRVLDEAATVMELSIELGGSTARNYVDAEGRRGAYLDFARVFRREGKPCPRCGTTIVKTRVAGRGTHLCPRCQRVTRLPGTR